jgi:hypothetical protein
MRNGSGPGSTLSDAVLLGPVVKQEKKKETKRDSSGGMGGDEY